MIEIASLINHNRRRQCCQRLVSRHTPSSSGLVATTALSQEGGRVSNVSDRIHVSPVVFRALLAKELTSVQKCMHCQYPRSALSGRINAYHGQHMGCHSDMAHKVSGWTVMTDCGFSA